MTYDTAEASVQDGAPVELYRFVYGSSRILYTSSDTPIDYLAETYVPVAMSRSAVASTSDANLGAMTVRFAGAMELITLLRDEPPGEVVALTIFRSQLSAPTEFKAIWMGEVHGMVVEDGEFVLQVNSALQSEKRLAMSMRWQKSCPYTLYDTATCRVNRNSFAVAGTASVVASKFVSAAAFNGALDLVGGYLEYFDGVSNAKSRRTILTHSGSTVGLVSTPVNLGVGMSVTAFPGCDHSIGAGGCLKFGNVINYGGDPAIPLVSPLDVNTSPF